MKKLLSVILTVLLILGSLTLTACGDKKKDEGFPVLPTNSGNQMVSDGERIYFIRHSRYDASYDEEDGVFCCDLSLNNVEKLNGGNCFNLMLHNGKLYYCREEDENGEGIFCYDADTEKTTQVIEGNPFGYVRLAPYNDLLVFIDRYGSAALVDPDTLEKNSLNYLSDYVNSAVLSDDGVIYRASDSTYNDTGIYSISAYDIEKNENKDIAEAPHDDVAVIENTLYYLESTVPPKEEKITGEDRREIECELMKYSGSGSPESTGIKGKFDDRLCAYGNYIFYCKYTRDDPDKSGIRMHSKPYCYNTLTGKEQSLNNSTFDGKEIRLTDVSGGYMLLKAYDSLSYSGGRDISSSTGSYFCSLNDPDKKMIDVSDLIIDDAE